MSGGPDDPRVVLLAAGRGRRLGALTDERPKPLQSLGATTLLGRLLDQCAARGWHDLTVVAGYRAEAVRDACAAAGPVGAGPAPAGPGARDRDDPASGGEVLLRRGPRVVVNPAWDSAGTGWSLLRGLASTAADDVRPLLVLHGDVVLDDGVLAALAEGRGDRAVLDRTWRRLTGDEVWAPVSAEGLLTAVVKGGAPPDDATDHGEYVGALWLGPASATRLAEHLAHRVGDAPALDYEQPLLSELLADLALRPVWCTSDQWRNVNDADDLAWARARFGGDGG